MEFLTSLPVYLKKTLMVTLDILIVNFALFLAFSLRLGIWYFPEVDELILFYSASFISIVVFYVFNLYRGMVRYTGLEDFFLMMKATIVYSLSWGTIAFLTSIDGIPRSVVFINWIILLFLIFSSRIAISFFLRSQFSRGLNKKRVVIYGAGSAGQQLMKILQNFSKMKLVGFFDDSKKLIGRSINAVPIYNPKDLNKILDRKKVDELFLAIPSINKKDQKSILDRIISECSIKVKTLPALTDLINGKSFSFNDLHDINIDELLGREKIVHDSSLLTKNIKNKVVMVTGAGGSIGSELSRQVIRHHAKKLILFEQNELALYSIDKELGASNHKKIVSILGSVYDKKRLIEVVSAFKVQTIYHAAAYKHVPMVEYNISEGLKNNVIGTLNCAKVAISQNVETFVLISTDKAVRPTNTMGASKRIAELIIQALSEKAKSTKFSIVRFGNVLGSSGSVIPLFKSQIESGGPVTVTDEKIIRYFMTIPEAVELVIQAGSLGLGGEVFVLDMGEPVKILDLAEKMIRLSGLTPKTKNNPEGEIEIRFTGLRPGEKLFEELLIEDNVICTKHAMIMIAQESFIPWIKLQQEIRNMEKLISNYDYLALRDSMRNLIPEYSPQCGIEDLTYRQN